MDISVISAGVLVGNFLTVAFLWNLRALDVANPPTKNIVYIIAVTGVVFLIALASYQSLSAVP